MSVALLLHVLPDGLRAMKRTNEMDADDVTELLPNHLRECFVTQDTGVVDQNVHTPPRKSAASTICPMANASVTEASLAYPFAADT